MVRRFVYVCHAKRHTSCITPCMLRQRNICTTFVCVQSVVQTKDWHSITLRSMGIGKLKSFFLQCSTHTPNMSRLNTLPNDILYTIFDFVDPSISKRIRKSYAEGNVAEIALTMVAKAPLYKEFSERMNWWRFASPHNDPRGDRPWQPPTRIGGYRNTQKQVQDIIAMWENLAKKEDVSSNYATSVLQMHDNALTCEFITDTMTYPVCALLRIGRTSRSWKSRHKHLPHPYLK